MVRVGHRLHELLISPDAADIFGRTGPLSFHAQRIPASWFGPDAALKKNLMPPRIPEVVLVLETEAFAGPGANVADLRAGRVLVAILLEVLLH